MRSIRRIPLISIVIPCYNSGTFLSHTLCSIATQQYPLTEVIIIDGASSDNTFSIIREYSYLIDIVISEKDRGQSDALNKGFALARGEVLSWLNSDDILLPGCLWEVGRLFALNEDRTVVFGDWATVDSESTLLSLHPAFDYSFFHMLYEGFTMNSQATFWGRDVLAQPNLSVDLDRTMDYELLLKLGLVRPKPRFVRTPLPLAGFRRHPGQKTQGVDRTVQREHRMIAARIGYLQKFGSFSMVPRYFFRLRRAVWYLVRYGWSFVLSRRLIDAELESRLARVFSRR